MTDAENEAYFTARYAEARSVFPLLGYPLFTHNPATSITTEELNVGGIAVFNLPPGFDVPANDIAHHVCKHEAGHAYLRRLERIAAIPRAVYLERFRVKFGYPTDYRIPNYSAGRESIEESWAEAFANACEGRIVTSKSYLDEQVDVAAARVFFRSLAPSAPSPIPAPTEETVASTPMKILWHLSHHQTGRADGWSGAPDEARWIREDLTPLVVAACKAFAIAVTTVDGDLNDHPEFHPDYDAFCAPHYEANVHSGQGGWFWGRASASTTPRQDDALGAIFNRRYAALVGAQIPMRPEWSNPNVTDYYGFRLTSPKTPGILVEHGVGAPGAADHDWLRANVQAIADVWAVSLSEFSTGISGGKPAPSPLEDDMFTDEDRAQLKRLEEKLNAFAENTPKVWLRRMFWGFDPFTKQKRETTTPTPPDIQ